MVTDDKYKKWNENYEKWKHQQEINKAKFVVGDVTIDENYIKQYGADASKFLTDSANNSSNIKWGQSQAALNSFNKNADELKYKQILINDWLSKNAQPGSYDELSKSFDSITTNINDLRDYYTGLHTSMSGYKTAEEYNAAVVKEKFKNSTYDEILAEITRLGEEQKAQSKDESVQTQKIRDALNNFLYTANYYDRESYDKAIADIDRQIAEKETAIKAAKDAHNATNTGGWGQRSYAVPKDVAAHEKQVEYLKTLRSKLVQNSALAEFTERPHELGDENVKFILEQAENQSEFDYSNYYSAKNPTITEIEDWVNTEQALKINYDNGTDKGEYNAHLDKRPVINDPLGFVLEHPDIEGQYHLSGSVGQVFDDVVVKSINQHWNQINEQEKLIYKYTLVTKGTKKALEYLNLLAPEFGQRYQDELDGKINDILDKTGFLGGVILSAASIPMNLMSGIGTLVSNTGEFLKGNGINPYDRNNSFRLISSGIRSEAGEDIANTVKWEIGGHNVLQEAYNLGMSMGDSISGAVLLGPAYSVVAGSNAATEMAEDIYDRGGSANQVFWGSFAAGVTEMAFEYFSIEKLLDGAENSVGLKAWAKEIIKQGGVEASEEVVTELANIISDGLIMEEKSTFNNRVAELMQNNPGMTLDAAHKKAVTENVYNVIWAGVGGFFSGSGSSMILGGANFAKQTKFNNQVYKGVGSNISKNGNTQDLIEFAQALDNKTVNKALSKVKSNGKVSDITLGKIAIAVKDSVKETLSSSSDYNDFLSKIESIGATANSDIAKQIFASTAIEVVSQHSEWTQNESSGESGGMQNTSEQARVMAEIPEGILNNALAYVSESGGDISVETLGISRSSEIYKKMESTGLVNSNGTIKSSVVVDEVNRRASKQKVTENSAINGGTEVITDNSSLGEQDEITVNMNEDERAEILRDKTITPVEVDTEQNKNFDFDELKYNIKSKVEKALLKKFRELGFLKKYSSTAIGDIEFEFTGGGVRKSLNSQETLYGGTKADFAKAAANLQRLLDNAVLIETHTDKAKGTDRENPQLKQVYVLLSVMHDGNSIIPVQFEVKQFVDDNNRLYLAVALTKIETSVMDDTIHGENHASTRLLPVSTISIPDLFAKINPEDRNFLKYIPDEFLNDEQIVSKRRAQKEDADKYGEPEQGGFTDTPDKDIQRERTADDEMNDFATGKYRTPRQRQAESVANLFGIKLLWDENISHACYNYKTHYIFMNPNLTISDMYVVIFKHEIVHHLELKKGYDGFKNYLFKNSVNFAEYCHAKLDEIYGIFEGTDLEAIEEYKKYVYEQYKKSSEVHPSVKNNFTMEMAEMEMVADFVGERLLFGKDVDKSMKALTELAQTNRNLFQRIWDWVKDKLASLRKRGDLQDKAIRKDFEYLEKRLQRVWDSKDKKNYNPGTEVKYFAASKNENSSIKQQLREHLQEVNELEPVANVEYTTISKRELRLRAEQEFKKIGYAVDRQNFGIIEISEKHINQGLDYINTESEKAALLAVPKVLKRGIDISGRDNHKGRSYGTITIAAPVSINGKIGNVAVVVKMTGKNRYSTHRILMPDGSEFVFEQNKDTEPTSSDMLAKKSVQGTDIDSVSNNSIPNSSENVKHYISFDKDGELDVMAPPKPKAEKIVDTLTKRFGEYVDQSSGVGNANIDLKADIELILERAKNGNLNGAFELIGKISKRFNVSSELRLSIERYLGRAAVERMVEYGNYRRESTYERKIAKRDEQIKKLQEELNQSDSRKYHEEQEQKRIIREDRAKNLKNFRSIYNRLATRLNTNSDTKHIPQHLKDVIGSFLDTFKTGFVDVDGGRQRRRLTRKNIGDFITQYRAVETDTQGTPNMAFDESIIEFLNELYEKADRSKNGLFIQNLDVYEVMMLSNVANNLWQMVRFAEDTFVDGRSVKFKTLSEPCIKDLKSQKDKKSLRNKAVNWLHNLEQGNITPPYFFKHLGEGFYKLFNDIVEGQGKWALQFKSAKSFVEEITEKYNYSNWKNDLVTLHTDKGQVIKLTVEQAMQLYATVKRQIGNKKQNAQHLNIGGVVLKDSLDSSNLKKIREELTAIENDESFSIIKKGSKIKKALDAFYETCNNSAVQLGVSDLLKVGDLLSAEQKGYADAWVGYLSNNMASLGNETSMLLFGYEKFTEDYYIPYNSAENYLYSQPGLPKGDERIKHLSFTKNTRVKAATPLVLSSLSEVCAAHVDKMCMYNALTIPLENLNKVFNCTLYDDVGTPIENVKSEIERAFGPKAVEYLKRYIQDVNGTVRTSGDDTIADFWLSRYKKGAVLASMSVVVQQPSAMFRAMAYINPKYFFGFKNTWNMTDLYQEMCKYAPVAIVKQMGRFDTGVGVSNTKWLLEQKTVRDKVDDKLSWLASKADEVTWINIWNAVKREAKTETDLKIGSEEFLRYCGKRFTEVINLTQVYDSTVTKSQHMRDKSAYKKMLTSFMSEPTVTYNMLVDAVYEAKKKNKGFAARVYGSVVGSIIVNTLLKSLVYAGRDDDDEKSYWEKYLKSATGSFLDDVNPFNLVPFVRDAWSIYRGYDVERADMTLIDELMSAVDIWLNDDKEISEKIEKLAGGISNVFGIPLKNVIRDIKATINMICEFSDDDKTSITGLKYSAIEGLTGKESLTSYYERMAEAAEEGDEETYKEILSLLTQKGKESSDIISGVKKVVKQLDNVKDETQKYLNKLKGNSTYAKFDDEDKKKIESKIKEALGFDVIDNMIAGDDAKYDELYLAQRENNARYKALKKKLIEQGVNESDIEFKLFLAEIRYLERKGIDIHEWALAELAKSKKYADSDGSGGVSKKEVRLAINNIDLNDSKKKKLSSFYNVG